ncbi:MAG: hypothetical protein JRK53_27490 [Deltaproteobacteria bacterium]|nr:hypothetical protein [Deltaproteobacteria bacterium]
MVQLRHVIFFLMIGGTFIGAVQQAGADGEGGLLEQKVALLEQKVSELNDVFALMMENLANCAEENEALSTRAGDRERDEGVITGEKLRLIEKIQSALDTETYLGFLNVLNERQLNTLLGLVEEKTNRPPPGNENTKSRLHTEGADNQ